MNMKKPTFVLALCIATAIAGAPMAVLAKNLENSTTTAIAIGQTDAGQEMFGASNPFVTDNAKHGLQQLVNFADPIDKTFVVRNSTTYAQVRTAAIKAGVTTNERVASTTVFAVEDALAACGLHMSAETYAKARGLTITSVDGVLPGEVELLTEVYKDLKQRLDSSDLKFKPLGAIAELA